MSACATRDSAATHGAYIPQNANAIVANAAAMTGAPTAGEVRSVADVVTALRDAYKPEDIVWYRGHADASWNLVPGIARAPHDVAAEQTLIKRFKQNAYRFLTHPPARDEGWPWLFLMQHYGLPTRLLDWTESPLFGLWFAVATSDHDAADGCLWTLQPTELNALAHIKPTFPQEIPYFGDDIELDNYLPTRVGTGMASNSPAAGIAGRAFERIYAQAGVFTITHREQISLANLDPPPVRRFVIPADAKQTIRDELAYLGVTDLTIFPQLENVAKLAQRGLW